MRINSQKDFFAGLAFIAVGIGFAIGSTNYSMGTSARPGAGYFPLGLGVILAILGLVLAIEAVVAKEEGDESIGRFAWKPLLVILGAITMFGLLLEPLGMLITVPLTVIVASFAGDEFRWRGTIINAIVLTAFCWSVFVYGLALTVPVFPRFMVS